MKKLLLVVCFLFLNVGMSSAGTPVAKVGDRVITSEELQRILQSTPYGGDNTMGAVPRMTQKEIAYILEGTINAELLYKKGIEAGIQKERGFAKEVEEYRDSLLASLYRNKLMASITADEKEVASYAMERGLAEPEAEAMSRAKKMQQLLGKAREELAKEQKVKFLDGIESKRIKDVKKTDVLVSSANFSIRLADVAERVKFHSDEDPVLAVISPMYQLKLFAQAAKKEGLEKEAGFAANLEGFRKNLTVSLFQKKLEGQFLPSAQEMEAFLKRNPHLLEEPRILSLTMIVTRTEKEAKEVRDRAIKGENFYELAKQYSIAPNAKLNAGVIGTMEIGNRPLTSVDKTLIALKPGEISQPLKGEKGYSLFRLEHISPLVRREKDALDKMVKNIFIETNMRGYLGKLWELEKVEIYSSNSQK